MRSVPRKKRQWKQKVSEGRRKLIAKKALREISQIDMKVEMIQTLIPLGLQAVNEMLQEEVRQLAGERYRHGKENRRWGKQGGSIYLIDQKVGIEVPRVRNKARSKEIELETYRKLQEPYRADEQVFKKMLNGLSTHKYEETAGIVPEVFSLSSSNVSRRFKEAASLRLEHLQQRRLEGYDLVAVFIDGKRFAEEGIVIALGVTLGGEKIMLGLEQISSEHHLAVGQFFDKLVERGLSYEEGLLFVVDGSKGIIKALRQKFGEYGFIQRCHWHKRENVMSYLKQTDQQKYSRKLKEAQKQASYEEAKTALLKLGKELEAINESAAESLREGLEETLTLHKLNLFAELRISFSTTNCIESILSQVEQYTERVDYWRNGNHIRRWVGAGLLAVEPRLRKVRGHRYLKLLRIRMKDEINKRIKNKKFDVPEEKILAEVGA